MSLWTDIRDTVESAASLAGNYFLPGSSLVTSQLVSEGSQDQLGSTLGQIGQLATGGLGVANGNLANYGKLYNYGANALSTGANALGIGTNSTGTLTSSQLASLAGNPEAFASYQAAGMIPQGVTMGAGGVISGITGGNSLLGAGLSSLASLAGGGIQAGALRDAADTSSKASAYATDLQRQMYNQNRADQEPWRLAGGAALQEMVAGQPNWKKDPGYQFALDEGLRAQDRSAAARGGLQSGAALKAGQRYGQDYATNQFGNSWNRLATLAGYGRDANTTNQASNTNFGNNASNIALMNSANNANAGLMAANARASSYKGVADALGNVNWGYGG
jgi:hypothetical protein